MSKYFLNNSKERAAKQKLNKTCKRFTDFKLKSASSKVNLFQLLLYISLSFDELNACKKILVIFCFFLIFYLFASVLQYRVRGAYVLC